MQIRVLGAAAGGGFPQWNCNHPNSRRARAGNPDTPSRTQSSIAVSDDGTRWFLFNASPDLRQQIAENPVLQPSAQAPLRYSPITGAILTNADVDHVAGLLNLRESQPLSLYATPRVLGVLEANTIFNVLNPAFVERRSLALDKPVALVDAAGDAAGLEITPFAVPGKVALWLEDEAKGPDFGSVDEDTIALHVRSTSSDASFHYMPACAAITDAVRERVRGTPLLFFDGTLWVDDEMVRDGVGVKTGKRMGHTSISGEGGSLHGLDGLDIGRRIFIHLNTTNPVLSADTPERRAVEDAGWEVSYDGMEIDL